MKITKSQLKKIIKEELQNTLSEGDYSDYSKESEEDWRARGGPAAQAQMQAQDQAPRGGKKQAITANINKMYQDLRGYDKMFVKDQDLMRKYNKALEAVNALLRGIS